MKNRVFVALIVASSIAHYCFAETDYYVRKRVRDIGDWVNKAQKDFTVGDNLTVGDNATVSGNLAVTGDADVSGDASVAGDTTMDGSLTLSDAAGGNSIVIDPAVGITADSIPIGVFSNYFNIAGAFIGNTNHSYVIRLNTGGYISSRMNPGTIELFNNYINGVTVLGERTVFIGSGDWSGVPQISLTQTNGTAGYITYADALGAKTFYGNDGGTNTLYLYGGRSGDTGGTILLQNGHSGVNSLLLSGDDNSVTLVPTATAPATPAEGMMFVTNGASNELMIYLNGSWTQLSP